MGKLWRTPRFSLSVGLVIAVFSALSLFVACSSSDIEDLDGATHDTGLIDSAEKAQNVEYIIAQAAREVVSRAGSSPFDARVVNGSAGTATVTGDTTVLDLSSTDCIGERTDTAISSIVFDDYQTSISGAEVSLTGELSYSLQVSSRTCAHSSSYANCTFNLSSTSPIAIRVVDSGGGNGCDDAVTLSIYDTDSSSTECSGYSGCLSTSNGTTYGDCRDTCSVANCQGCCGEGDYCFPGDNDYGCGTNGSPCWNCTSSGQVCGADSTCVAP